MQRPSTRVLAASAATFTALTLAACASSNRDNGGDEAASGGTLVFGAAGDPAMLDPAFGSDGETFRIARQLYEGLLTTPLQFRGTTIRLNVGRADTQVLVNGRPYALQGSPDGVLVTARRQAHLPLGQRPCA